MKVPFLSICVLLAAFVLNACSSAQVKKAEPETALLPATDSAVVLSAVEKTKQVQPEVPRLPVNIDAAHEAFVRAMDSDLRGDKAMSMEYWKRAAEFDPYNRYLGFKIAEKLMANGQDSLAFVQARWSNAQQGKVTSNQLGLLARLYVKEGLVDSCRKYFTEALDSARYQDTGLLYDYSLFLEAIQDKKELVRIYDFLLPHVNYIPSLFQRQLNLLVEQNNDSAIVDLFAKAHEATGDKRMLTQYVELMLYQKRISEVYAIVDTLSGDSEYDETIVIDLVQYYASISEDTAFSILKKKFYEDGVRTPLVANFLGHYEHMKGMKDSAKVHLEMGTKQVGGKNHFLIGAYQSLTSIALSEEKFDDAIRYTLVADSISGGNEKNMVALVYGLAHQYDKAYALLDSLIAVWDSWKPLEGVADSASLIKMTAEAERNRISFRNLYGRILASEAVNLERESSGDSASNKNIYDLRVRAQGCFEYVLAREPNNYEILSDIAMNFERMEQFGRAYPMMDSLLAMGVLKGHTLASLLNYYGYSLIDRNKSPEDVVRGYEMVLKSLEIEVDEAVLDSKAWGLYRMGKFKEALEVMLLLKDPRFQKDYTYWEHLGAIQEALGMKAEATKSYKKLLEIRPKHPEALRFLKKKK